MGLAIGQHSGLHVQDSAAKSKTAKIPRLEPIPWWMHIFATAALLSVVALFVLAIADVGGEDSHYLNLTDNIGLVFAFVAAFWARRYTTGDTRTLWTMFSVGMFFWIVGEAIYDLRIQLLNYEDTESVADVFYLLFYPFALYGLWVLDRPSRPGGFDARMLDALILAGVVVLAAVQLVYVPYLELSGGAFADAVRLGYPALDTMLIWVVAYQAYNPRVIWDASRTAMAVGIAFVLAADIGWINLSGELYSILVAIAMMSFGSSALLSPSAVGAHTRLSKRRSEVLPAILLIGSFIALAALLIDQFGAYDSPLIWGAIVVMAIAVLRLQLTFAANSRLLAESEERATSDPLTGLHNHQYFQDRLGEEFERARREERPLALLLIDIDNFKTINDLAGHRAGDRVLKQIAAAINDSTRTTDITCRTGGDELAILSPDTDAGTALGVAERLLRNVSQIEIPELLDDPHPSVSVGCCAYPKLATSAAALSERADEALYLAKERGRNRAAVYEPDADEPGDEVWQLQHAKAELAARDADFRAVFTHAHEGMLISDEAANVLMVNHAIEEMVNQPRERLVGRNVFEFVRPEEQEVLERIVAETLETGTATGNVHLRLAGDERPLFEFSTARFMPNRYLSILRDITEADRATKTIAEKEALFRGVFENANDAMFITDDGGVIRDANRAASRLTGVSLPELIGTSVEDLVDKSVAPEVARQREGLRREQVLVGTMSFVGPDGNPRRVEYSAVADFVPGLHLSVVREITDRDTRSEQSIAK
jgi:diguanylate cyclase (GGDEF)-like protein/PAS domain S-box-containing protein